MLDLQGKLKEEGYFSVTVTAFGGNLFLLSTNDDGETESLLNEDGSAL